MGRIWDNRVRNWKGDTVRGEIMRGRNREEADSLYKRLFVVELYRNSLMIIEAKQRLQRQLLLDVFAFISNYASAKEEVLSQFDFFVKR